jgi:glycosyltransferase involved in cell wall biosynthesis
MMSMKPPQQRIAVVTNLCTHYRQPLFERLSNHFDADFYFTSTGTERYWSSDHTLDAGTLRVVSASHSWSLAWRIATRNYDCVIITLAGRLKLFAALVGLLARGRPFVLWVGIWSHPRTIFHRFTRPLTRWLYRMADAVLVYGPHVARHVVRESGRQDRIFVAPQAIDNARFGAEPAVESLHDAQSMLGDSFRFVAAFVGRLVPEKGIEDLVRAISLTREPLELALIGSGPEEQNLRRLASELGAEGRVSFVGYVDQRRLPALFRFCNALVLPSVTTARFKEPWGLAANEAMAAGLPVVATEAVGAVAGGLVTDEETGIVVPEGNPRLLASALERLASDPILAQRLGSAGRQRVAAWTYEAAVSGIQDAIECAISHTKKGASAARPARA